jgi:hypothetical protein
VTGSSFNQNMESIKPHDSSLEIIEDKMKDQVQENKRLQQPTRVWPSSKVYDSAAA